MTAMLLTPRAFAPEDLFAARLEMADGPHIMGAGLPPFLRTVGALTALLLAVALTGVALVALAAIMPILLVGALLFGRAQPAGERSGWRPASA